MGDIVSNFPQQLFPLDPILDLELSFYWERQDFFPFK